MWCERILSVFRNHPRLILLGPKDASARLPTFSFVVRHGDRVLHQNFVSALINDLFAVQTRSGCACAGPLGHVLLGIDQEKSQEIWTMASNGLNAFRLGWSRFNAHYTFTLEEVEYLEQMLRFVGWFGHLFLPEYLLNLRTGMCVHYNAHDEPADFSIEQAVRVSAQGREDSQERFLELKKRFEEVDRREQELRQPRPMSFAVMRNVHEAFRTALERELQPNLAAGRIDAAHANWMELERSLLMHMALEDEGMFPLFDAVSGGVVTNTQLHTEHKEDLMLMQAVSKAFKAGHQDTTKIQEALNHWWDHMDEHMRHEELVIMEWSKKCGSTPGERALLFHHHVLAVGDKKPAEMDCFVSWSIRKLISHGTRLAPPDIATRVFVWGLWSASSPAQWNRWLPIVKQHVPPAVYDGMVERFKIDLPGPIDPKVKCPKVVRYQAPDSKPDAKKVKKFVGFRRFFAAGDAPDASQSAPSAPLSTKSASEPGGSEEATHQSERAVMAELDRSWFWKRQMHEALTLVCAKIIRQICKAWTAFAAGENAARPGSVPGDCVVASEEMHQEMEEAVFKVGVFCVFFSFLFFFSSVLAHYLSKGIGVAHRCKSYVRCHGVCRGSS